MKADTAARAGGTAAAQGGDLLNLPRRSLAHVPRQARAARRVHEILDAAVQVLEVHGASAFNTNKVAQEAGVSVGSVYQYFPNKQRILGGIIERGLVDSEHLLRSVAQQGSGRPMAEVVEQGIDGLVDLLLPHRSLIRELFCEATPLGEDSVLAPIEETLMDVARDWVLGHADALRLRDGPATLYVSLKGGVIVFLRWIVDQPVGVPRQAFVAALARQATCGLEPR